MDPLWSWPDPRLAGRLLPHPEAIACWEAASGLKADPAALRWWQVFASVKGIGIWISSSEDFPQRRQQGPDPGHGRVAGRRPPAQILVDYLSPNSNHQFFR